MLRWITNLTYKIECKAAEAGAVYQVASVYYRNIIQKEIILANITDKDNILCVGGGICPFSAILFHQVTGAKVTVIDNNEECIPKARQIINHLGLGNVVRVFCRDGSANLDLSEYTVIHIALQVAPLEHVFAQIEKQAAAGTRLLVRRPKKSLRGMYSQLSVPVLYCCPYVTHKSRNINSTLLYTKHEYLHAPQILPRQTRIIYKLPNNKD
jgi:hypothetical protein